MSLFAADSMPARCVRLPLVALFTAAAFIALPALARESDRNQPMDIESDHQEGTLDGNSINTLSGNVVIKQGTLDIRASKADIHQSGGEVVRAVLTGSQAVLKQQMDDGSPMTAKADRIDYNMSTDVVVLTGSYTVTTPRGSTSGQRLTYDLKSGRLESGGQGSGRVKMTIQPKSTRTTPAPAGKP
ncbi:MAG: lipopolysaccharide transport periplasmic protein LptA [Lysobacter sp.]|nr:lipopolysaccharide transport periplasmic protein LptA [Lysobacter sp.]